ncbi:MAG: MFS transporter [Sandaracinaceae bacterium]|nr:MFS transporter [Myxococcales bacterium]MCB9658320.1 MFS transporter [Sandaracinaceae bacterium]
MVEPTPESASAVTTPYSTRKLTAGLMLGVGVHAMEGFSVYTALPALTVEMNARPLYGAVITIYLLGSLVGLVWAGVRADTHGLGGTLRVGLLAAATGLLGATLAQRIELLLLFRVFQGFGGGALTTVIYAAVHQAYPRERWAQTLAFLSLAWGVSAVAMPGLLGLIVDHLHWRYVFALGLPIVALAGWLTLPPLATLAAERAQRHTVSPEVGVDAGVGAEPGADTDGGPRRTRRLVTAVTVVVLGALVGLHGALLPGVPAALALVLPAVGGAAVIGGLAVLWPPGVFRLRGVLPASVGVKTLACGLFFGAEAHLPLALTDVHQRGSAFVGLVLTVAAMAWSSAAFVQARLLPRFGPSRITLFGVLAIAFAVLGLNALVDPTASPFLALPLWAVAAAGMGFVYNTVSDSALAATCDGESGATGTALGISDSVGAAFGAGLASALLNTAPSMAEGLTRGWCALLLLAFPMLLGASRLGGPTAATAKDEPATVVA